MDIELFQWILLGLLALGIVVLAALLATLGGIKRALEQRSSAPATRAPAASGTDTSDTGDTGETAEGAVAARSAAAEEAAASGTYAASDTPASDTPASDTAAAASSGGRAGTIRSVLEQHGLSDTGSQPAAGEAVTAQPEETGVVDSVFAAHADDPQEEPFQRDGRWWFRRGDELLLYDETSGEWQPAPEGSEDAPAAVPAATGATAQGSGEAGDAGVQTTPVSAEPAVADQVSTFWKCPTCGAVNGSTATTCRMCFAARP